MDIRQAIVDSLTECWADFVEDAEMPEWADEIVLLESGMDSLAFAVVVTDLEDRVGFDPFTEVDEPVYPVTFGEFVAFYEEVAAGR